MAGAVAQDPLIITGGGTTTLAHAYTVNPAAGSTLVCFGTNDVGGSPNPSVADNVNGSYAALSDGSHGTFDVTDTTDGQRCFGFFKEGTTGGGTTTTITWSAIANATGLCILEISGTAGVGSLEKVVFQLQGDGGAALPGTGTDAVTSGSTGALAKSPNLVVAFSYDFGGSTAPSTGTGYSSPNGAWAGWATIGGCRVETKNTSALTAVSGTFTAAANTIHVTVVMVFDDAGSSGGSLTPNVPTASEPVRRPPQPTRQHDAEWSSSQPLGSVAIAPIKPLHEAPQPAREARVLRHEGVFQPVQPLRSPVIPAPKNFGDAPPYFQTRSQNPRMLRSGSAEALGSPVIPAPKQFGDAPQPQTTRRRNERTTAHQNGEGQPAPVVFVSRYPIVTTTASRKMFDQFGAPFRFKGRTAWGLASLSASLRAAFLDNTIGYGFNAIECQIPTRLNAINNRPFGGDGSIPFLKTLSGATWTGTVTYGTINNEAPDFTTPNPTFWAFVDALVQDCYTRNILLMMFPSYLGQGDGWLAELNANIAVNGDASINTYGAFVADRYKAYPNIVWMTAGDTASGFDAENDLIVGIQSVTGQASGPNFSSERFGGSISTDGTGALGASTTLNGAYDWATVITQCQRAYSFASPVMPGYLLEEPYDQEGTDGTGVNPTFSTQPTRRYEWWGWLNAIGGYVAGNGFVWRFALVSTGAGTDDYRNGHLDTQATHDLGRLNAFMELWSNTNDLVPGGLGGMRTLVVSGAGTIDTGNFNCAAQTSAGDLMIAYVSPGGAATIQLDLRSMAGRPIRARWWDPTAATFTTNGSAAGTYTLSNTASAQSFTTPGTNSTSTDSDWVLVLEAQTALASVEVPEQIARSQRASRSPLRIQNLEVLPAIAAPPAPAAWGYEPATAGARAKAAPKVSAGGDAGATASGPIDWDPIVSAAIPLARASVRPSSSAETPPPPPFPATGFEIGPPISRSRPAAPLSAGADAGATAPGPVDWDPSAGTALGRVARATPAVPGGDPLPPPPFPPIAWVLDPSAPVRVYRAEHRTGNQLVIPPPPFPPTGFEVGAALARALARLQADQPIALPGAGVADWTPDVYGDLTRAARGRLWTDHDRFPGLAVVTLPAWGFEPEPPRTRSPAADRRLVNGDPLRAPVAVVLTAWGFEPPPAPARGPRQDRRGVAGEPLPNPVLAALTAWFEGSPPAARGNSTRRIWTPGDPLPSSGAPDWAETVAPAPARSAPRGRAPAGGEPLPLLVLTPWGWESLGAVRERAARGDARSAEASSPLIVTAPAGFDPNMPAGRPSARRREMWAEGLPAVFIPPPPPPWGYEPSSPMTRWVSSARFPLGGEGTTLVVFGLPVPAEFADGRPSVAIILGSATVAIILPG